MTIDETIEKYKDIANTDANCQRHCMRPCDECVQGCRQVAEWLEELKELRDMKDTITINAEVLVKQGYNKAIDDFTDHIRIYYALKQEMGYVATTYEDLIKFIFEIAEQLKAGGTSGTENKQ